MTPPAVEVRTRSAAATRRLGARLGRRLRAGDVVLLEGDLGAGKTVFAQGVGDGLGVDGPVTSPTFTLIHEHAGRVRLYHVDLYRLSGDADAAGIGLDEYLGGDGVAVVEWATRAPGLVPPEHLAVRILADAGPEERRLVFAARGARHAAVLAALAAGTEDGDEGEGEDGDASDAEAGR
jgi:tRNA threonylcarbamoyladenosine biosynthesis protein TsaE